MAGRDITQKHVEELIDKRLRVYHSIHGGSGGDTPEPTSPATILFERPINGTYDGFWRVDVGGTDYTQSNLLSRVFGSAHDNDKFYVDIDGGLAEIKQPAYIPVGMGGASKYCFYCFNRERGLDDVIDTLADIDVVKMISPTDDYYLVTDMWLTNTSYSGQIFPQNDWIIVRNVNLDAFMSEYVSVDGIDAYKLTNFPVSGSTLQVIKSRLNSFKLDYPDLHYDDRTWSIYLTNVKIDVNQLKQTTGRDNFYEVIL